MSAEPKRHLSEFADIADALPDECARDGHLVRRDRILFRSALPRSLTPGLVSDWPAKNGEATRIRCRMRVQAVAAPGAQNSRALYMEYHGGDR